MLRRQQQIRTQALRLLDAGLFGLSFWLAYLVRAHARDFGEWATQLLARLGSDPEILRFDVFLPVLIVVIPIALMALESRGYYRRGLLMNRLRTTWILFQASFLVTIGVILVMFILKTPSARGIILLFGGIGFFFMIVREELFRLWLSARKTSTASKRNLLLLGVPSDTHRLRMEFEARSSHEVRILDEIDVRNTAPERLVDLLHEWATNGVVLATRHTDFEQAEKVLRMCELEGVEVWMLADFFQTTICKTNVDELFGQPMLVFHSGPGISWRGVFKLVFDFTLSLVLLVLLSPAFLLVATIIKLSSRGPVLYRDKRCGLNGRPFIMYKFRSMVSNAEELKSDFAQLNEMGGPVFKITNDPRTTRLGLFLRKYSVDELPQLFNVLKGEMSLVGPRPLVVDEVRRFDDLAHRRRLSVKPGLTCIWQVNGRSNVRDFNDWMKMDLEYIDEWSLGLDLKILLRTIPTVISGNGAK